MPLRIILGPQEGPGVDSDDKVEISFEQAEFLVGKQMSIEDKKNKADYVIDNRVYFEELFKNIESVLEVIKSENLFK